MKALTICQPYAHLIAIGEKRVENRSWPTKHRGPLAIHAGKSRSYLAAGDPARYPTMTFGAIVAVAELVTCIRLREVWAFAQGNTDLAWLTDHEHVEGPWCWVLDNVQRLSAPLTMKGARGMFNTPDDIHDVLACRLPQGKVGLASTECS